MYNDQMRCTPIESSPETALRMAASGLLNYGCMNASENADECLQWAMTRYPDHGGVPIATCRLWTTGEKHVSNSNLNMGRAPHAIITNALCHKNRLTPGEQDKIKSCIMPFICLLDWSLRRLPRSVQQMEGCPSSLPVNIVYRRVNWVFPNLAEYNPNSHFPLGSTITWYSFKSASQTMAIACNLSFIRSSWIYQKDGDEPNSWLYAEALVGTDGITSLQNATMGLNFQGGRKQWSVVEHIKDSGQNDDIWIQEVSITASSSSSTSSSELHSRFHLLCTNNLATIFEIKTSKAKRIGSISHFPQEGEFLFPPLSQFRVTRVSPFFPLHPDQIYLEHVNTIEIVPPY
jgi:hypothetical protein